MEESSEVGVFQCANLRHTRLISGTRAFTKVQGNDYDQQTSTRGRCVDPAGARRVRIRSEPRVGADCSVNAAPAPAPASAGSDYDGHCRIRRPCGQRRCGRPRRERAGIGLRWSAPRRRTLFPASRSSMTFRRTLQRPVEMAHLPSHSISRVIGRMSSFNSPDRLDTTIRPGSSRGGPVGARRAGLPQIVRRSGCIRRS